MKNMATILLLAAAVGCGGRDEDASDRTTAVEGVSEGRSGMGKDNTEDAIAMIVSGSKKGHSKALANSSFYGEPWDDSVYAKYFP